MYLDDSQFRGLKCDWLLRRHVVVSIVSNRNLVDSFGVFVTYDQSPSGPNISSECVNQHSVVNGLIRVFVWIYWKTFITFTVDHKMTDNSLRITVSWLDFYTRGREVDVNPVAVLLLRDTSSSSFGQTRLKFIGLGVQESLSETRVDSDGGSQKSPSSTRDLSLDVLFPGPHK